MKSRKIVVWLAVILLVASLAGCVGDPLSKPAVTLIVKTPTLTMNSVGHSDIETAEMFLEYAAERFTASYEKADVNIRVEVFDYTDENDAIAGAYGTDDAVDLLYEGYFNMASYVSGGHVVSLDDIISDELRTDISEATWAQSTKNGKTYMMPYLSMQNILIYNKELFQLCGLERFCTDELVIQNWSIEEWETILDTLAAKLPDETYPLLMYGNNNQGDTHLMSFIRSHGSTIFAPDGSFDFETPEAVQGLKWIQDGVERGWYAPHPELLEIMDLQQLFQADRLAIYMFNNANYMLYENIEERYGFVNFPSNLATSFITGFEVFDNGDEMRIQVAKDFLKYIYEDEELMDISAGNIPESKRVAEKYADEIVMLRQFSENADNVIDFMNSSPNWQGQDNSVRSVFWPHIHELLAGNTTPEECAANLNRDCNAAIGVEISLHD